MTQLFLKVEKVEKMNGRSSLGKWAYNRRMNESKKWTFDDNEPDPMTVILRFFNRTMNGSRGKKYTLEAVREYMEDKYKHCARDCGHRIYGPLLSDPTYEPFPDEDIRQLFINKDNVFNLVLKKHAVSADANVTWAQVKSIKQPSLPYADRLVLRDPQLDEDVCFALDEGLPYETVEEIKSEALFPVWLFREALKKARGCTDNEQARRSHLMFRTCFVYATQVRTKFPLKTQLYDDLGRQAKIYSEMMFSTYCSATL